jgi:hypothetical protein
MQSCIAVVHTLLSACSSSGFFKPDPMSGAIVVSHSPVHQVKIVLCLNKKQTSMHWQQQTNQVPASTKKLVRLQHPKDSTH